MGNVDVEIYVSQLISFFENNPNDLMDLIGDLQKDEFYVKLREKCEENIKTSDRKVFDHEILMFEVLPDYIQKLRMGMLNKAYALWPTHKVPENLKPMITMGIADGDSKKNSLREMGIPEHIVRNNLVGNV